MKGILFENEKGVIIDTLEDWNLLLMPREIPKPTPKTNYVDVPGGDGTLDLSEVVANEVKYKDLSLSFKFHVLDDNLDWDSKVSRIANFIHGRKMKIILPGDPFYYYKGRCEVDKFSSNKRLGSIAIKCVVSPYKLKIAESVYSVDLGNTKTTKEIRINNDRMTTVPEITCTDNILITFEGNTFSINKGTHKTLDILFKEGLNLLTVEGTGTITLKYQEGSL